MCGLYSTELDVFKDRANEVDGHRHSELSSFAIATVEGGHLDDAFVGLPLDRRNSEFTVSCSSTGLLVMDGGSTSAPKAGEGSLGTDLWGGWSETA